MTKARFSKYMQVIAVAAITLALTLTCAKSPAVKLSSPYTDPAHMTKLEFGIQSHWLQPWRAYLETVAAATFLDGIGINWNIDNSPNRELVAQMLAKNGIRRSRLEISWNSIDYDDVTKLIPEKVEGVKADLLGLKKYGIRPLILLNGHHGEPCPVKSFNRTLAADGKKGDLKVKLNDVSDLKIGYSGLSYIDSNKAAELLITKIDNNTVTLSKPLPKDIKAGESVRIKTLKYRPFSVPGSDDYQKTMAGWQNYVGTVAKFVTDALGTTNSADKGFDMEIWNELSFGSDFLYINSYYANEPYKYEENSIQGNLVKETAAYIEAHPKDFQGVLFTDGLANTIPWPASSKTPARIAAISKHPYRGLTNFPQDEEKNTPLNALFQEYDKSGFIPRYAAFFPEHFATGLQTETIVRDMGPIPSMVNGTKHGRYARVIDGVVVPTPVWITEVNLSPADGDAKITAERALAVKAKTTARYYCFYLNKGVTQLHLYAAAGKDKELGMVKENFLEYINRPKAVYPKDDTVYTSPGLLTLRRIVAKMSEKVDSNLKNTRSLQVVSLSDTHNHYQFQGNGSPAHPNLYNRDVFAFLPFQVNAKRFVIPYYVMTRNVMQDLPPEEYTLSIKGVKAKNASITAYDPINDKTVPVEVNQATSDLLDLKLRATDYPYLLIIQEAS